MSRTLHQKACKCSSNGMDILKDRRNEFEKGFCWPNLKQFECHNLDRNGL